MWEKMILCAQMESGGDEGSNHEKEESAREEATNQNRSLFYRVIFMCQLLC